MPEREFKFGQVVEISNDPEEGHQEVVVAPHGDGAFTFPYRDGMIANIGGGIPYDSLIHTGESLTVKEVFERMIIFDSESGNNFYLTKRTRDKLLKDLEEFASIPAVVK